MDRTFGFKMVMVATVVVGAGLVCQCTTQNHDQQVFNVVETEEISTLKLVRKLKIKMDSTHAPGKIAELLARTMNKSEASLEFTGANLTIRELLDLNKFNSKDNTDCTLAEIERRQEVCHRSRYFPQLKSYCNHCVEYLTEYCRKFPYLRILEFNLLDFDRRLHSQVFQFSQNFTTYIKRDGIEESSLKSDIAYYLDTKDAYYLDELKAHCKNFVKDLKSKLYLFGSSSNKTIEMVKDIHEDMYTVWERCQAVEEENARKSIIDCFNNYGYYSYRC